MIKFTYYGHSCFGIDINGSQVLLDPFISSNPLAREIDIAKIQADVIFLTHGHRDHVSDLEKIATENTTIVANFEVASWFGKKGYNTEGMNQGGTWSGDFGSVRLVNAIHSSSLPDGSYGGNPLGFVFMTSDLTFYVAGDTALTLDMKLISDLCGKVDLAILPIGGHFTMDAKDAIMAARMVNTSKVIGCHYDTFVPIEIDHDRTRQIFEEAGIQLKLPVIGEQFTF